MSNSKRLIVAVILLLAMILPLIGLLPVFADVAVNTYNENATFVASSGSATGRYTFVMNGRHWVFYTDGTDFVFKSATDGTTWSDPTKIRTEAQIFHVATWNDGTYVYYVWANETNNTPIYWRRGTPNSDGTITWSAAEQTAVAAVADKYFMGPNLAQDSAGINYITYGKSDGYAYACRNDNTDGTWSTTAGWPKQLGTTVSGNTYTSCIPMASQRIMFIWTYTTNTQLKSRVWHDSISYMDAEKTTVAYHRTYIGWSALAEGDDDVYVAMSEKTSNDLEFNCFDYSDNAWESRAQIYSAALSTTVPSISYADNTDIWCFYYGKPDDDHIYYKTYNIAGDAWSGATQIIADEVATSHYCMSSSYNHDGGYMGVTWQKDAASPYTLRYYAITFAAPPTVVTNAATSVEETSATMSGNITVTGGSNATIRGFQYDTDSGAPYANDWHEHGDYGVGEFTSALAGLTEGEAYYYRAYATNVAGTTYGAEQKFLTKPLEPTAFDVVYENCTHLYMTWTNGTGYDNVTLRGLLNVYPAADRSDGAELYNGPLTEYMHHALTTGNSWYYRIWSVAEEDGMTQYSDAYDQDWEVVTCVPPDCPSNLVAIAGTSDNCLLTWTVGAHTDNSILVRRVGAYPDTMADGEIVYNGPLTTFTDNTPNIDETEYYYRLWAWNADGYTVCYTSDSAGGEIVAASIGMIAVGLFIICGLGINGLAFWQKKWWICPIAFLYFMAVGYYCYTASAGATAGVTTFDAYRMFTWVCALFCLVSLGELWYIYQGTKEEDEPEDDMATKNKKRLAANLANTFQRDGAPQLRSRQSGGYPPKYQPPRSTGDFPKK